MVSSRANPQRGQVSTDSRTVSLIALLLPHRGWKARVCGRVDQCVWLGLVRVVGDRYRFLVVVDLDRAHSTDLLQRLFDRDWAGCAGHIFHCYVFTDRASPSTTFTVICRLPRITVTLTVSPAWCLSITTLMSCGSVICWPSIATIRSPPSITGWLPTYA